MVASIRPISEHIKAVSEGRGEYTLVLEGRTATMPVRKEVPAASAVADEFCELTKIAGVGRRDAIKLLAERYAIPSRQIYKLIEAAKVSVD